MIAIPETSVLLPGTRRLIEFFNQLDQDLMAAGEDADQRHRIIMKAEYDLIMWGKV